MSAVRATMSKPDKVSRFNFLSLDTLKEIDNYSLNQLKSKYIMLNIKKELVSHNIFFINRCISEQLTPIFIYRFGIKHLKVKDKIRRTFINILLRNERSKWYGIKDSIANYIKYITDKIKQSLSVICFESFNMEIKTIIDKNSQNKQSCIFNKLESLRYKNNNIYNNKRNALDVNELSSSIGYIPMSCNTSPLSNIANQFHQRTLILTGSSVNFDTSELNLLNKGLKYAPKSNYNYYELAQFAASVDILDLSPEVKILCSSEINKYAQNKSHYNKYINNKNTKTLIQLKNKIVENNLTVIKADKGYCTVVLNKTDYINKVECFLQDNKFMLLDKDPTKVFQDRIKAALKSTKSVFYNDRQKWWCKNMNPRAPRLYGAPKIHKPNIPIRPVVSFCDSPSERLAKFLNTEISKLTQFNAKDSVKNTAEFIDLTRSISIPSSAILVSFDITNLYTSVPSKMCIRLLARILTKANVDVQVKNELIALAEICVEQNYFIFNGKFYEGKEGLAMGAPLSSKLADLFMHYFYQEFVEDPLNPFKKYIICWKRYVDDIFCIWNNDSTQLMHFVQYLNKCYPGIGFTYEIENGRVLNYLDLIVTRCDNYLEYGIYRKPTNTDAVIPADSQHPWSHKLAAFHSFIHRLNTAPLKQSEYDKELNIIRYIAVINGYSKNIIDKIIERKQRRAALTLVRSDHNPGSNPWRSIPYIGGLSDKIGNILRRNGFNVAFQNVRSLRSYVSCFKDKLADAEKSGIYMIKCGECSASYTGQTGRSFGTRAKEHTTRTDSKFYMHIISEGHHESQHQVALLHFVNKGNRMNFLENLEIKRQICDVGDLSLNEKKESGAPSVLIDALINANRPPVRFVSLSSIVKK